ncbi:MAG TPA: Rieske 2Fe-2S domain-containing protein [Acidimicrobiales bacterium]|nr:Rieske 2Fe-2S domain-containing protein [Acidimicrobiales bacterium]
MSVPGEPRGPRPAWLGPPPSSATAGWALLPLRGFIGFTFTFAGLQKLANPGFFDAANPTSIQTQLKEAAHNSPVHALIGPLEHVGTTLGVVIALAELAVGLGTLLGLWARVAAVGGILLSLSLFLTISFHASPYYTGSDIVFVFAWLPLLVAGSGGVLSVDGFLAKPARALPAASAPATTGHEIDRRTFALKAVAVAAIGALGMTMAGLAAGVGRLVGHYSDTNDANTSPATSLSPTTTNGTGSTSPTTPPGRVVAGASTVAVGGSAQFTDPRTGDPAVVVQPRSGQFVAFDAVCPHEGCTVAYFPSDELFICPCHGSRFNGATGALVKGPATHGLTPIAIAEGPDGKLYAV